MPINVTGLFVALLVLWVVAGAALYGLVFIFKHQPRPETSNEKLYYTNDGLEDTTYSLPSRLLSITDGPSATTDLSVVIPCYNETERLGKMLDEAVGYLRSTRLKYEIIIVDDGSQDGTDKYALNKAVELKLAPHIMKVVKLDHNRGKGGAVTHGLLHSLGKLALFADADGATQFSDAEHLIT